MRRVKFASLAIFAAVSLLSPYLGQTTARADEFPGCGKDTDCKGERICVAKQCVDPPTPPEPPPAPLIVEPPAPPPPEEPLPPPPPLVDIRLNVFGDLRLTVGDNPAEFGVAEGTLDIFATAKLPANFSALIETALEGSTATGLGIDIERFQLMYRFRDYLTFTLGRYHTFFGYYNQAYHHGAWLETPVHRPQIVAFEDHGGLLPVHQVGLEILGKLPLRKVLIAAGLSIGNGRGEITDDVLSFGDKNLFKAFNILSYLQITPIGLRIGGNVYIDRAPPAPQFALRTQEINELILGAHLHWRVLAIELLGEYYQIRHQVVDQSDISVNHGYFVLLSYTWRSLQPFVLVEGVHYDQVVPSLFFAPQQETLVSSDTLSIGLKWWVADMLAMKLQYEHIFSAQERNVGTLQATFGF